MSCFMTGFTGAHSAHSQSRPVFEMIGAGLIIYLLHLQTFSSRYILFLFLFFVSRLLASHLLLARLHLTFLFRYFLLSYRSISPVDQSL